MDLRKLEKWSRDELVAEAARRGVGGAEVLTRRELLEAIGDAAEASGEAVKRSTFSRARRLVERLVGGERRSSAPPPPEAADVTVAEATVAHTDLPVAPEAAVPSAPRVPVLTRIAPLPHEPADAALAAKVPDPGPISSFPRAARTSIPVPLVSLQTLAETLAAPPSTTLPAPPSSPPGDPIRTRTMARLLAAQGHIERARAIYDELLGSSPTDGTLRVERDALADARLEPTLREAAPFAAPRHAPVDQVTALVVDPTTLFVCWEVTAEGVRRARSVAGETAPLALRVAVVAAGKHGVQTVELARSPLPETGETFVTDLPPGAVCTAAVGVAGSRFVAIAHASSAETPPATAAPEVSLVVRPRAHPAEPEAGSTPTASEVVTLVGEARTERLAEAARAVVVEAAESAAAAGGTATAPTSPGAPSPGGPSSAVLR